MNKLLFHFLLLILFLFQTHVYSEGLEDKLKKSIVQVRITKQPPNHLFPWLNKTPYSFGAVGVVVPGDKILVLTSRIDYATSIELKKYSSYISVPAKLTKVDYESNLSLLEVKDKEFFRDLVPLSFSKHSIQMPKTVEIVQLDNSGTIQTARGRMTGLYMDTYNMSHTELPYLNISSNEKLNGNGEVIISQNKPIGLLYNHSKQKNTGYAIPGFIIDIFLNNKIKDKTSVFPYKGFRYAGILDHATREFYGMEKNQDGVIVSEVIPHSTAYGLLKVNDIILEFGKVKIDSKGFFVHPKYGKQPLSYIAHCGYENGYGHGDKIPVQILRNKKVQKLELPLKPFPYKAIQIPYKNNQGEVPHYLIKGGFVFVELSQFLLQEWGQRWRERVNKKLLYLNDYYSLNTDWKANKIVLVAQVLPDESNEGYHDISIRIVETINDRKVRSVKHLDRLIRNAKSEFTKISLDGGVDIILENDKTDGIDSKIQKKFKIGKLKNF
ncbi:MAG: serine protease [Leptospiraceae bacterium]|nr:serine protease [Leptospiraceae bacterium]MCP5494812.1 serine protease [Leptospiraceae bacterium]